MKLPHSPGILPPDILSLANQLLQDSNHCKNLIKQHCSGQQLLPPLSGPWYPAPLPPPGTPCFMAPSSRIYRAYNLQAHGCPATKLCLPLLTACVRVVLLACLLAEWQGHASARCNTKPCMRSTVHVMCVAAGLSNPTASVGFPTQQHHWAFQPKRCCSSMGLPTLTTCTDGIFFD